MLVGEDAHQQGAPFDLLVEPLEQVGRLEVFVMGPRQPVEGERLLDVGLDPVAELAVHLLPAGQPLGQMAAGFGDFVQIVEPAQFQQTVVGVFARQVVERVAQKVDVATLPVRLGQRLHRGAFEAGVVVADDQLHAVQAAFLQPQQMLLPAGGALAAGQFDGQHMAAAVPADTQRDEHSAAVPHAVFPHPFVAGVQNHVGILLLEPPGHEPGQVGVELLVDCADRAGAKLVAAEFLGNRRDSASGNALHIHLHQRGHQGLLAALVAFKQLGGEAALPVLGHPQLQLAHPSHQRAAVVTAAVAQPVGRAFAFAGPQGLVHLGLQHLLQQRLHEWFERVFFGQETQQFLFCHGNSLIIPLGAGHGASFVRWF